MARLADEFPGQDFLFHLAVSEVTLICGGRLTHFLSSHHARIGA